MIIKNQKKNLKYILFSIIFFILTIIFSLKYIDRINEDPRLNYKYTYYAIPISISNILTLKTEKNYHYTQFDNIRKIIPNESNGLEKDKLNLLIKASFEEKPKGQHSHAVPTAEDIGLADYVTYSFTIFGKNVESIFKFYLLILIFSFGIFFINFRKDSEFYIISISVLTVLIIFFENFNFTHFTGLTFDRFTDNRNFSILALIPYVHICLIFFYKKINFENLTFLTIQILILNFIYFCRSSILLEILILCILFIFNLLLKFKYSNESFRNFKSKDENKSKINIIIILLFCGFVLPKANDLLLTKLYSDYQMPKHPTTVMLRAGIMFDNPNLKEKYDFNFGPNQQNIDLSINNSGLKFYDEVYKTENSKQIFFPHGGVNLVEQSKMEKQFIAHLIINDFNEIIKNFIIYKPLKIAHGYNLESIKYSYEMNSSKIFKLMLAITIISICFLSLNLTIKKSILIFFLLITPVTIKNMLFWGMANVYFLDLYIIYNIGILILLYIIINKIKSVLT